MQTIENADNLVTVVPFDSSWAHGLQPSLVAPDSSRTAMRLCEDEGMAQFGDFFGIHGHSNVWIDMDVQS